MLACTFVHNKFNHRVPEGKAMLRCFLGGARDPEVLHFQDDKVIALVRKELREILNLTAEPVFTRVYRWQASMAQYLVAMPGGFAPSRNGWTTCRGCIWRETLIGNRHLRLPADGKDGGGKYAEFSGFGGQKARVRRSRSGAQR